MCVFFFKQKSAYEMRISDWSSDVCSSDLCLDGVGGDDKDYANPHDQHRCQSHEVEPPATLAPASRCRCHRVKHVRRNDGLQGRLCWLLQKRDEAVPNLGELGGAKRRLLLHLGLRSEEHTSELQSLMRISYAVFCLKKKNRITNKYDNIQTQNM